MVDSQTDRIAFFITSQSLVSPLYCKHLFLSISCSIHLSHKARLIVNTVYPHHRLAFPYILLFFRSLAPFCPTPLLHWWSTGVSCGPSVDLMRWFTNCLPHVRIGVKDGLLYEDESPWQMFNLRENRRVVAATRRFSLPLP